MGGSLSGGWKAVPISLYATSTLRASNPMTQSLVGDLVSRDTAHSSCLGFRNLYRILVVW